MFSKLYYPLYFIEICRTKELLILGTYKQLRKSPVCY